MTAANGFILLKKWNSLGRSFLFRDRIYRNYVWSFSLLHRLRRLSFPRDVPRDLWTNRSRTGGVIKYRQAYIVRNSERGACTWWLSSFYAVTAFTRWETTDGKRFQIVAANLSSPSQPMRMKVQWIFVFLLLVFLFFLYITKCRRRPNGNCFRILWCRMKQLYILPSALWNVQFHSNRHRILRYLRQCAILLSLLLVAYE